MQAKLYVRNWQKFQHYKDRCPPWIKLQTDTFQNYEFAHLEDRSKLLVIGLWILASKSKLGDGSVPDDFDWILERLLIGNDKEWPVTEEHLQELIDKGFILRRYRKPRASKMIAPCKQTACLETETETETETEEKEQKKGASAFAIPDWIPKEPWNAFVEMRKKIRKPMTDHAQKLLINKLHKLGGDPTAILEQSIVNDWQDVYPLKEQNNGRYRGNQAKTNTIDDYIAASKIPRTFGQGNS